MKKENSENNQRRNFLKMGLLAGAATVAAVGTKNSLLAEESAEDTGTMVKVETSDGKVIEVDSSKVQHPAEAEMRKANAREAIPGKKFIRVIDLGRCGNARKCIEGCQTAHKLVAPMEYIKVKKMQDSELSAPYWFPTMCYHCDNPPCTKVCPVDATFKREDGIVAVDTERCIGCKFCMAACPYSARTFNFGRPEQMKYFEEHEKDIPENYCASPTPPEGTVSKCDFCTDRSAQGLLPACVVSCPNGAIYHGDELEDAVTNGEETYRLSDLLRKRAGYRQFEELGTKPRVYYLPAVERQFPFEDAEGPVNTIE